MADERVHDIAVLGGGPSGAAAACLLARGGRAPLVVEREAGPRHKVCGEFLSVEAQACLADLGLDARALGGAPIRTLRLVQGGRVAEADLPFEGVGLTRLALDEALLARAEALGATLLRGETVREVVEEGPILRIGLDRGRCLRARTALLATGKHDLRGLRRRAPSADEMMIGLKAYHRLAPAGAAGLRGAVEVVLFEGGYLGLQEVEGGRVNLCLLVHRRLYERVGRSWDGLLGHLRETCPLLDRRLAGATMLLEKPLATSGLPYGFVHRPGPDEPGNLFRLGDQAGVIHPFAGDGLSIALYTGRLAALTLLEGGDARGFHAAMRAGIGGQVRFASLLYEAGRTRAGRRALVEAGRWAPGLLRALAARTRVPDAALRGIGVAA